MNGMINKIGKKLDLTNSSYKPNQVFPELFMDSSTINISGLFGPS